MSHTASYHELLKRNDRAWALLESRGIQQAFDEHDESMQLELRNCTCNSTLAREVAK